MEMTSHSLWTLIHGMGFGALYLLACSGALLELRRMARADAVVTPSEERVVKVWLLAMAALAWIAVLTGTYIVYPWYRVAAPPGTIDLTMYPQLLLKSNPATIGWHTLGMEWKEHVAWLTPISITMAAVVFCHYGRSLKEQPQLRNAVLGFTLVSFLAAGIAGFFGAMINKAAPIEGGGTIHMMGGQ